jgi:putative endopeptidase
LTLQKAVFLVRVAFTLRAAPTQDRPPTSGIDLANLDTKVRPQDDLYRFVNGLWLIRNPIPPDRVSYGTFLQLADRADADVRAIVEETVADRDRLRGSARQIADLYASLMNQERIERLGLTPVKADLQRLDGVRTARQLAEVAGYLSAIAVGGPFPGTVEEDTGAPGRPVVTIAQGGTLLPDREYYLKSDARFAEYRAQYLDYLTRLFTLAGRANPAADAGAVLALEIELARIQWPQEDLRDPTRTAKKYSLAELTREMPEFDWSAWARPQRIDASEGIILAQPSFFKGFAALVPATPLETWKAWLIARFLTAYAPYLPKAFSDLRFDFFGRVLTGQELPRTHWKRGVGLVNGYLGDAVGRLYVTRHLPPPAKARAERLVATIVAAFKMAIPEATWMSEKARRAALDKLARLSTKVGYPDRWRNYGGLVIKPDDLVGNVQRAKQFENDYKMARLTRPADHTEWLMTPQTVNAYYSPTANEIVVPAAMLQPPLFNVDADDAANYGAIGAVVGHEIGHAFDERGRWFDGTGAVRNWWTPADEHAFESATRELVEQFNAYSPLEGARVNGLVTLRENIGDFSGLAIAWRAYKISLTGKPSPVIDGFTGEQRFFLSWAQVWRGQIRDEYLRQTLLSMPHAPPQYRANGPASNLSGFYEAFDVKPGDRMYRPPAKRVNIW